MVVTTESAYGDILRITNHGNTHCLVPFDGGFSFYDKVEVLDCLHPLEIPFVSKEYYYIGRIIVKDYELIGGKWEKMP